MSLFISLLPSKSSLAVDDLPNPESNLVNAVFRHGVHPFTLGGLGVKVKGTPEAGGFRRRNFRT